MCLCAFLRVYYVSFIYVVYLLFTCMLCIRIYIYIELINICFCTYIYYIYTEIHVMYIC